MSWMSALAILIALASLALSLDTIRIINKIAKTKREAARRDAEREAASKGAW